MCKYSTEGKALGILENPLGALDKRPWMKEHEASMHLADYCMWSGAKPEDFEVTTAGKQRLADWFPYRKRSTFWLFGPNITWLPTKPLCGRFSHCEWKVDQKHCCQAKHAPSRSDVAQCRKHCLPPSLNRAQLHRIPHQLCLELVGLAAENDERRKNNKQKTHANVHRMQHRAAFNTIL